MVITKPVRLISIAGSLGLIITGVWLIGGSGLKLPNDIKKQINFKVYYPAGPNFDVEKNSFSYISRSQSLVFIALKAGQVINVSQQTLPNNFDLDTAVQNATGGLSEGKAYTLIDTKYGPAAVTNFYSGKSLTKIGQSGILKANGTLLTAQLPPNVNWDQSEWEGFFNQLAVSK